jgi:peptidoglycan hydrolase CwlO-like protein
MLCTLPHSAAAQEIAGLQSSVRSLERTKAEHEETILMLQRLNSELQTHVHELSGNDDPNTAKLARQYDARVWARPELARAAAFLRRKS